jgi:Flp pilus assembly protein TadG
MTSHRKQQRFQKKSRNGAVAVELAVVAPLIVLLILGIVDVGQFINVSQTVSNASREGARMAARYRTENVTDVENAVSNYLAECFPNVSETTLDSAVQVSVRDGLGNTIPSGNLTTVATGSAVQVEVSVSFNAVRWLGGVAVLNDQSLVTTTRTRRE